MSHAVCAKVSQHRKLWPIENSKMSWGYVKLVMLHYEVSYLMSLMAKERIRAI